MTVVTTLIADYYEGQSRQKFAGVQIAIMSIAGILFISLGGILADINWKVPFLLYLYSIIIIPMVYLYLKEPKKISKDYIRPTATKSPAMIWLVFINVMLMWILFFIIPVQIPFYLKSIGVESNTLIGLAIASSTFFSAISAFSYSKIKDTLSFAQVFSIGYLLMGLSYLCIAFGNSFMVVMLAMLLAGLGMGLMIPNANVWVMHLAPQAIRGKEIGRLTTFWFLGQFLSPILLLPILKYVPQSQVFLVLAIILFALCVGFLFIQLASKKKIELKSHDIKRSE